MEVAASVVGGGDAQDGAKGLPVEQEDAFVAVARFGEVALGHDEPAAVVGGGLEDRAQVRVAGAGEEDYAAPAAIERLDHHAVVAAPEEVVELAE